MVKAKVWASKHARQRFKERAPQYWAHMGSIGPLCEAVQRSVPFKVERRDGTDFYLMHDRQTDMVFVTCLDTDGELAVMTCYPKGDQ